MIQSVGDHKAFPLDPNSIMVNELSNRQGMTLRQYYIGQALSGTIANKGDDYGDYTAAGKDAIRYADELINLLDEGWTK